MSALTARVRIRFMLLAVALTAGGALWGFLRAERHTVYRVPILMYHKIGDDADSPWWVTKEDFETHLQCLNEQGYRSIVPSDLASHRTWGKRLPPKPVIITFDDGYLNTVETAEPLLKKHGFRGVCYLITGQIADTPEARRRYEGAPILSWSEVRDAARRGTIRFGGHTRSHANLRAVNDPTAQAELAACFDDLRRKGGFKPEGLCYPFGQYHSRTPAFVAKAGFTTAVTCDDGVAVTTPALNLFELPRVPVMGGTHRYHLERVSSTNTLAVRVWKEGHSMQIHPRWVQAGQDSSATTGWGAPVTIDGTPIVLACPLPAPAPTALELWDNFRVLRLFRQTL